MLIKKCTFFIFVLCLSYSAMYAQEIVNIVLVGKDGITEDIKNATAFVVVKKYADNKFERLDYKVGKPLTLLRTYSDSNLAVLHGVYIDYDPSGAIHLKGSYMDNLKDGNWNYFNDTGKIVLTRKYKADQLLETINPDTVKKEESITYKDEREATFVKKGTKEWLKYLMKNLNSNVGLSSVQGGTVRVLFMVTTDGKVAEIYLQRSVEFVLDEEAMRVIRNSPDWIPAYQNGHELNAYRVQPITFVKE